MAMPAKKKRVEFNLQAPEAKKVLLLGSFTNWTEKPDAMKKNPDGTWKKSMLLDPGTYEYKFMVDGEWIFNPDQPHVRNMAYGAENNVIKV
jgi:1,4-alpha-glucan branching enzyme